MTVYARPAPAATKKFWPLSLTPVTCLGLSVLALAVFPNNAVSTNVFSGVVVLIVLMTAACMVKALPTRRPRSLALLMTAFLGLCVSTAFSGAGGDAWSDTLSLIRYFAMLLSVGWLASRVRTNDLSKLFGWIVFVGIGEAILALSQKLLGGPVVWGVLGRTSAAAVGNNPLWQNPPGRTMGSAGHPIPLAMFLGASLLIVAFSELVRRWWIKTLLLVVLVAGVFATGTRSAVLVTGFVFLVALFTPRSNVSSRPLRWLTVVLIALALGNIDFATLPIFESLRDSASFTNRTNSWEYMSLVSSSSPFHILFGFGWNTVAHLATDPSLVSGVTGFAVDNNFISLLLTGGLLLLFTVLLVIVKGLRSSDVTVRSVMLLGFGMFLSFDVFFWSLPAAMLVIMASLTGDADKVQAASEVAS